MAINSSVGFYAGQNVVPSVRKFASESFNTAIATLGYNPGDILLNRVTGGFNSVVQISASYCLRSYIEQTGHINVISRMRGKAL
ncbi:MAG: hypothetical protein WAM24_22575 [Ignavibacteriaceae bacterium]